MGGVHEMPLRELWQRSEREGEAETRALREAFGPAPQQLLRAELARVHREGEEWAARDVRARAGKGKGKRKQAAQAAAADDGDQQEEPEVGAVPEGWATAAAAASAVARPP